MGRITFVLPGRGLAGGIRVVADYGNLLQARGHEVTIVYFRRPWPRRPVSLARRVFHELRRPERDHLDGFAGRLVAASPERLAQHLTAGDVVVATHWTTAQPVADLPAACGAKFYFVQHYEAHSFDAAQVDATWRLPLRKVAVARWLTDLARDKFGDEDAVWTPNGVDGALFDAPPHALHDPPVVGTMYSPAPWKGCGVAFEAVRRARREIADLGLVCFGASPPAPELPLPENTTWHLRPEQKAIRDIYAAADVWLLASATEGFGLPALEAMACRCPVVATRCGGPADFVEEDVNGYFVDVGDAEAMAARIVTIVSDPARWKRLSDVAYATVRERFTIEQAFARFAAALEQPVVEPGRSGRRTPSNPAPSRSRL